METKQEREKLFQNPNKFFELLLEKCSEKQVYSVRELAASLNVQYEEIQELAASDERLSDILELCRQFCLSKTIEDGLYGKLKFKETLKYMEENDDDFKIPEGFQEVEDDDDFFDENEVEEEASRLYENIDETLSERSEVKIRDEILGCINQMMEVLEIQEN